MVRIFGKRKCINSLPSAIFWEGKVANLSTTVVTPLPSLSLCFSLSLSHQTYLTHNIESASALPIITLKKEDVVKGGGLLNKQFLNVEKESV